ncbi:aminotransferase class I/II-fold pyridoxal phosphate-dependent enzyme [Vagococcus fluvialis]|uniref:aminotransferase class I/II-fold pyridoxal phosphate-dependent enzyme n=1 Tax=Vagococcus fluvialis TaxID=2738 RepID=UPI003B221236
MPRANNPLGTNLNKKTIRQIARLAEKYQVIIIENDYFLEGQPTPLQETILENARENCIYLSSFSKIMPILRIGYMIVPRNLILGMNQVKQRIYMEGQYPPAMISQAFLEIILKNNLLARYSHTLSTDIKEKKRAYPSSISSMAKSVCSSD